MDNVAVKEEVVEGQLLSRIFPLALEPLDVQITIHVNNLLNTYGNNAIKEIKHLLNNSIEVEEYNFDELQIGSLVIRQLIRYYSVSKMQSWFKMVYGWSFEKAG